MEFQHILFPVDFSEPCKKFAPWVVDMVKRMSARLSLINVWESPYSWSGEIDSHLLERVEDFKELEGRQRSALEKFRRNHLLSVTADIVVRQGDPAKQIREYASASDVDLIIMPTHGYGRFRATLLGSVTAKVIHDTLCGVLTSAHIEKQHRPPIRMILCAVDDVLDSVKTIRHAGLLARELECSLSIIHAIPPGTGNGHPESHICASLQSLEALAHVSVPIRIENGEIAAVVPEAATREGADLLVIGRGHAPEVLGSLRSHVYPIIRNSPCPVLTV